MTQTAYKVWPREKPRVNTFSFRNACSKSSRNIASYGAVQISLARAAETPPHETIGINNQQIINPRQS